MNLWACPSTTDCINLVFPPHVLLQVLHLADKDGGACRLDVQTTAVSSPVRNDTRFKEQNVAHFLSTANMTQVKLSL
jgi:hypothetical protein